MKQRSNRDSSGLCDYADPGGKNISFAHCSFFHRPTLLFAPLTLSGDLDIALAKGNRDSCISWDASSNRLPTARTDLSEATPIFSPCNGRDNMARSCSPLQGKGRHHIGGSTFPVDGQKWSRSKDSDNREELCSAWGHIVPVLSLRASRYSPACGSKVGPRRWHCQNAVPRSGTDENSPPVSTAGKVG
jgi:hypothetical protein